jgi:polysaccharide pyruvyl transferase WcaK-like protein
VRDAGSGAMTKQLGVKRNLPIVPDLAFGLAPARPLTPRRPGRDIGISPMVYLRPGSWPLENQQEYRRLIAMWAELVTATVRNGDRVHLFVSSPSDMTAVHDVAELLESDARAACTVLQHLTPDALLDFFSGLDVVVSSRLHGVLLGIVAARPVLALSHERKVAALMQDAGIANFCIDLKSATVDQIMATLNKLTENAEACQNRMREYVAAASLALRKQDEILPQLLKNGR